MGPASTVTGPTGPAGPKGDAGPSGATGPAGPAYGVYRVLRGTIAFSNYTNQAVVSLGVTVNTSKTTVEVSDAVPTYVNCAGNGTSYKTFVDSFSSTSLTVVGAAAMQNSGCAYKVEYRVVEYY